MHLWNALKMNRIFDSPKSRPTSSLVDCFEARYDVQILAIREIRNALLVHYKDRVAGLRSGRVHANT